MLTALALVALVAWAIALVNLALNLRHLGRIHPGSSQEPLPSLSVVVPARNEERAVESCVRALLDQDYPSLEVIVVDDQSTDRTGEILSGLEASNARLRVIRGEDPPAGWLGKPWALQQGGLIASGELLLFCDADVIYAPHALRRIVSAFLTEEVDGLTVLPRIEMRGFWERVLMVQLPLSAFTAIPLYLSRRLRSPLLAIGGGPGNLLQRRWWEKIGTHERLQRAVVDDVALMQLIRYEGGMTSILLADELVSVRMYHGLVEIVRGFSKNAYHAMGGTLPRAASVLVLTIVTQLLPFVMLGAAIAAGREGIWPLLTIASVAMMSVARLLLFVRFRYGIWNALLGAPLMSVVWVAVMALSIWRVGVRRRLEWRGRGYDARQARFGK